MREKVEVLEDHPDRGALRVNFALGQFVQFSAALFQSHKFSVDVYTSDVRALEVVDAAQQCRLTAARCADEAEHLASFHLEIHAVQHLIAAETLADVGEAYQRFRL